ncbi:MAG: stress response translation initiation inhibitor YciH [Candidatus Eremiobacteraeota bacterium]|nr:stress response translation initiation inhibitor YciH [Candidatus Eremiobacteraeota bacterium]
MKDDRELVYSSDEGYERHPKPSAATRRVAATPAIPADGIVRVARERRRVGVVTLVHGLSVAETVETAKRLKRLCGTGGTSKNGIVEIQGDHREKIVAWFVAQGRKAKIAGG